MKFDNFVGYVAIGNRVYFRPLSGPDVEVLTSPPDIDSHILANAMNSAVNGVLAFVDVLSEYKL